MPTLPENIETGATMTVKCHHDEVLMLMKRYEQLVEELKEIRERGYVKTHRSHNTGIGKTLEDLLGIKENNFIPNGDSTELKSVN